MEQINEKLKEEREKMLNEAKNYSAGTRQNMYYIGVALGIGKAIQEIAQLNQTEDGYDTTYDIEQRRSSAGNGDFGG